MKTLLKSLTVFCLAAVLASGMALSAFAAQFTINSVTAHTPNHPSTLVYMDMLKNIQERADKEFPGALSINHRGGTEVIGQNEQIEALRTGMIDINLTAASYYVSAMPEMDVLSLSELMPWEERESPLFAYLDEIHRKKLGVAYLGRLGGGFPFYLHVSKPFENLADLKGRRLRVSPTTIPLMKALGIEPVAVAVAEVFTAVERGVVDGFVIPPSVVPEMGLIPLAKFTLFPPFYRPTDPLLINAAKWDALPDGIKKIFVEEIAKAEVLKMERAQTDEKDVLNQIQAAGGKFVELPPAEAARFTEMANNALLETTKAKSPVESQKIFEMSRKK